MGGTASKVANQTSSSLERKSRSLDEKNFFGRRSQQYIVSSPTSSNGSISSANVEAWESAASSDPRIELARTILAHSNLKTALASRDSQIAIPHVFNHEVEFHSGPVTNQRSSGRCWLFATTNIIRYEVMKKLKLKEFQCSQVRRCNLCRTGVLIFILPVVPVLLG